VSVNLGRFSYILCCGFFTVSWIADSKKPTTQNIRKPAQIDRHFADSKKLTVENIRKWFGKDAISAVIDTSGSDDLSVPFIVSGFCILLFFLLSN